MLNKTVSKAELLSPAGNPEKLKAAVLYGADAVYLSGKHFGMRAAADNFKLDELKEACGFAHKNNVKVYLTVNVIPRTGEFQALKEYFRDISDIGIDALIVADPGVIALAKEMLPHIPLHLSTQTSVVSAETCIEYYKMGISRIVLARELSLTDVIDIRRNTPDDLELETFIHGSMCVSWSGRCLLSEYFTGRDANCGACTQPCRWDYKLYYAVEDKRPDMPMPIMETENGTFIMSSRDMCMIEHIPELIEAGINSFKIEGRMKSAYYAAVTTNTYRMAIDAYYSGNYEYNADWMTELESVSHREYCTGYWYGHPINDANLCTQNGYLREKAYLATALESGAEGEYVSFIQRNKAVCGEKAELISPGKTGKEFTIEEMTNDSGEAIESAPHPGMIFRIKAPFEIKEGDIIRSH
ncbi:MAG: U32 family peptidase [Clostridia bacterium]|nr:U32 family peptidase [Clostridia bacterium]